MKKIFILILFVNLVFSKILIVNSYSKKDQCGMPQLYGFLSKMYAEGYKPNDFEILFLNSRVVKKGDLKLKVNKILKNIDKYKTVITFDDTAFKMVGIPASKKGLKVIFSGLNYPYKLYKEKYKLGDNVAGVYEKLYIYEILQIYNKIKPIKKIAFFYGDGIGRILKMQTEQELKNSVYKNKIDFIHISTLNELKEKTKMVNQNTQYTIFMPFVLSVIVENREEKIPFLKIKDIFLKNIKKPDLSINKTFVSLGFLGFGGVDFYKMGEQAAQILLSNKKVVENAKAKMFFINKQRAKEIKLRLPIWFIDKYLKEFI
jgi:hypothetical protein